LCASCRSRIAGNELSRAPLRDAAVEPPASRAKAVAQLGLAQPHFES
jgi:hypothetical protein